MQSEEIKSENKKKFLKGNFPRIKTKGIFYPSIDLSYLYNLELEKRWTAGTNGQAFQE